jgi:hypothetical protein
MGGEREPLASAARSRRGRVVRRLAKEKVPLLFKCPGGKVWRRGRVGAACCSEACSAAGALADPAAAKAAGGSPLLLVFLHSPPLLPHNTKRPAASTHILESDDAPFPKRPRLLSSTLHLPPRFGKREEESLSFVRNPNTTARGSSTLFPPPPHAPHRPPFPPPPLNPREQHGRHGPRRRQRAAGRRHGDADRQEQQQQQGRRRRRPQRRRARRRQRRSPARAPAGREPQPVHDAAHQVPGHLGDVQEGRGQLLDR